MVEAAGIELMLGFLYIFLRYNKYLTAPQSKLSDAATFMFDNRFMFCICLDTTCRYFYCTKRRKRKRAFEDEKAGQR